RLNEALRANSAQGQHHSHSHHQGYHQHGDGNWHRH
ncbi:MAG TPA: urease accessory protein UreE, partial [Pasteurellaceae bacterium]|nr:urease accessory protein UreE [Pasteurellaceae bacterium]